jgi:hypothetical protein
MMPEEGWSGVGVVSDAVQQIRGILVHSIVYDDGFILYILNILYNTFLRLHIDIWRHTLIAR